MLDNELTGSSTVTDVTTVDFIFVIFIYMLDWQNLPLPTVTPGRNRNVARFRSMGGDPNCVPPDFNATMKAIRVELWESMPKSGKVSVTVKDLIQRYKEICRVDRKKQKNSSESPLALLPVSFAQAKDWILRQQHAHSKAVEVGAVNEEARKVSFLSSTVP